MDSRKSNNPIKTRGSEINKEFSPEEYQMAEKHLKKCSAFLIIREMQIKTALRFLFIFNLFSFNPHPYHFCHYGSRFLQAEAR